MHNHGNDCILKKCDLILTHIKLHIRQRFYTFWVCCLCCCVSAWWLSFYLLLFLIGNILESYIASARNLLAPVGSSVDLDCAGQEIPNPLLQLQLIAADGHARTIMPDEKNVIRNGHVFTIINLGRDMRGIVQCRVQSACSRKAKSVDIGYLLPLPVSGESCPVTRSFLPY